MRRFLALAVRFWPADDDEVLLLDDDCFFFFFFAPFELFQGLR